MAAQRARRHPAGGSPFGQRASETLVQLRGKSIGKLGFARRLLDSGRQDFMRAGWAFVQFTQESFRIGNFPTDQAKIRVYAKRNIHDLRTAFVERVGMRRKRAMDDNIASLNDPAPTMGGFCITPRENNGGVSITMGVPGNVTPCRKTLSALDK